MIGDLISGGLKLLGGFLSDERAENAAAQNIALQRDFAQHGIKWKVEDAKRAGVHPLYALGASTHSFAPVSVGDSGVGRALGDMGQDVSRAVTATMTGKEREDAFTTQLKALQLEKGTLENELLRTQIASSVQRVRANANPPMPPSLDVPLKEGKLGSTTPVAVAGKKYSPNPNWSDAQEIQNRYGEPAEWPYFPLVAMADFLWNNPPNWNILPHNIVRRLRERR